MAKKEPLKTVKKNYDFFYQFTEAEIKEKSLQLAQANNEKNRIEDERKSAASQFKSRLDSKQAEINYLSDIVSTGKEFVSRTCDCAFDFDNGVKIFYFEGVEVGRVEMTQADYQLELPSEN